MISKSWTAAGREFSAIATLLLGLAATPAQAGRGLELNAFSAEALGMGGADVAVARDTSAVNVNPAGLTQIGAHTWDLCAYPYLLSGDQHSDTLGNNAHLDQPAGVILAGGYAQRLAFLPSVVAGIGLFAQGGTGFSYESLLTNYGTHDQLSSNFGIFKFDTGFGWSVNERLSLGATLGISYAQARQKFFPETSDAASAFYGLRFDGGKAITPNVQIGVQYQPTPEWTLAAVYISKTPLPLTSGTVTVDYDANPTIGRHVKYAHARDDGLALPQEVDVGIAYRPQAHWLLSLEFNWLEYSGALRSSRLRASAPDNASAPAVIDAASPLNWHDEYVVAIGAAYTLDDQTILRAGFNEENNPIPRETMSPVLNLTQEGEFTFGFGRKLSGKWALDFAGEYVFPNVHNYSNPSLPLGTSSTEHYSAFAATIALSRRW